MADKPIDIPIERLMPHPDNPRIGGIDEEAVQNLMPLIGNNFDRAHSLKVRPFGEGYQVVSGHNRLEASKRNGLSTLPCWVRDMSDEEANDHLDLDNTQSELSALERGMHAKNTVEKFGVGAGAGNKGGVRDYARKRGQSEQTIRRRMGAAEVAVEAAKCDVDVALIKDKVNHLYEIRRLPKEDWGEAVNTVLVAGYSSKQTRKFVDKMLSKEKAEKLKRISIHEKAKEISPRDLVLNLWIAFEGMKTSPDLAKLSVDELADEFRSGFNAGNNPDLYWSAVRDMSDGVKALSEVVSILESGNNINLT